MNSRQLAYLSIAAVVIVAIATWLGSSRSPDSEPSALLYPNLKGQLDKATAVRIFKGDNQLVVEAARNESGWNIAQRNGYAGDASKINELLIALEDATLREQKTSNPDNYAALGVQDLSADATGTRIEVVGIEPPVNLIVGKSDSTASGSYVRRAGETQSWLISKQIHLPSDATAWLNRAFIDIGADRIQQAQVQIGNGPRYVVAKADRAAANFDVTPIPKGRELSSVGVANAFAQNLVGLQLDDVRPLSEFANVKASGTTEYRSFDGLTLTITGYSLDDKHWVAAQAGFDEDAAKKHHVPTTPSDQQPEGTKAQDVKADSSLQASIDKVRTEVDSLNKKLNGWAYAIPQYKYDALFKPLDEMLLKK